jgi:hypothetical protein
LYVDGLLKKSNKESGDESMEEALNDAVSFDAFVPLARNELIVSHVNYR